MDQFVLESGAGRDCKREGTVSEDEDGLQVFILPSESVVAVNVCSVAAFLVALSGDKSVNVQGRFAAGVPVRVFRTWQVIGSRAMMMLDDFAVGCSAESLI